MPEKHTHECPVCGDTWECWADDCAEIEEQVCAMDEGDYDDDFDYDDDERPW